MQSAVEALADVDSGMNRVVQLEPPPPPPPLPLPSATRQAAPAGASPGQHSPVLGAPTQHATLFPSSPAGSSVRVSIQPPPQQQPQQQPAAPPPPPRARNSAAAAAALVPRLLAAFTLDNADELERLLRTPEGRHVLNNSMLNGMLGGWGSLHTPLHKACEMNAVKCIERLVQLGADPFIQSAVFGRFPSGYTAIDFCTRDAVGAKSLDALAAATAHAWGCTILTPSTRLAYLAAQRQREEEQQSGSAPEPPSAPAPTPAPAVTSIPHVSPPVVQGDEERKESPSSATAWSVPGLRRQDALEAESTESPLLTHAHTATVRPSEPVDVEAGRTQTAVAPTHAPESVQMDKLESAMPDVLTISRAHARAEPVPADIASRFVYDVDTTDVSECEVQAHSIVEDLVAKDDAPALRQFLTGIGRPCLNDSCVMMGGLSFAPPLHYACKLAAVNCVRMLVELGADPYILSIGPSRGDAVFWTRDLITSRALADAVTAKEARVGRHY